MEIKTLARKNGSVRIQTVFTEEDYEQSFVDQSQKDICDINYIYAKTH